MSLYSQVLLRGSLPVSIVAMVEDLMPRKESDLLARPSRLVRKLADATYIGTILPSTVTPPNATSQKAAGIPVMANTLRVVNLAMK